MVLYGKNATVYPLTHHTFYCNNTVQLVPITKKTKYLRLKVLWIQFLYVIPISINICLPSHKVCTVPQYISAFYVIKTTKLLTFTNRKKKVFYQFTEY